MSSFLKSKNYRLKFEFVFEARKKQINIYVDRSCYKSAKIMANNYKL